MLVRRIGAFVALALAFFAGRLSTWNAPLTRPADRAVLAQWDGGAVYEDQLTAWLSASRTPRTEESVREFVKLRVLASAAREQRLDEEPSVAQVCDQALIEALRTRQPQTSPPTDDEVKTAWELETERFTQPETLKLGMIQLAPDAGAERLLADLQLRLRKDFYAFSDVAQQVSVEPQQRLAGGDLPIMTIAEVQALLGVPTARELCTLKNGELLPRVVFTPRGPALVRLLEHHDETKTALDRVAESIRQRLAAQKRSAAWDTYVEQLVRSRATDLRSPR